MHIGIYLGGWSLHRMGGMGVYLENLLRGVESLNSPEHELTLLVDETNRSAADALGLRADVAILNRPSWSEVPDDERRAVIRVRRTSYRSVDLADRWVTQRWSPAAAAYLWGLDIAVRESAIDLLYFCLPPYIKWPQVPTLLTIHDLKHVHRPQDHDAADLARRKRWKRVAGRASLVYASYEHVRRDIEKHFQVSRDRTAVLPLASPFETLSPPSPLDDSVDSVAAEDLPDRFVLMPAQYWPHKNHQCVIEAIAYLRHSNNLDVYLICTGQTGGECETHAQRMAHFAEQCGVADLIHQFGFVDRPTLRRLYHRARMILVASLYEPGSFPAMEALTLGKPLAASRVTSIPDTVGHAALLFDPTSVQELARALKRLWTDDALCQELSRRGPTQVGSRTWSDVGQDWLQLCERAVANEASRLVSTL